MTNKKQSVFYWQFFFWLWLIIIFVLSHLHQDDPTEGSLIAPDKVMHFVAFGLLAFLFIGSNYLQKPLFIWLTMASWVIIDEYTQHALPNNRFWSIEDVLAGESGVISAICWKGALQHNSLMTLRAGFDQVLSRLSSWLILIGIAAGSFVITAALLWFSLSFFLDFTRMPGTSIITVASLFTGIVSMLFWLMRFSKIKNDLYPILKSMVFPSCATIAIGVMCSFISQPSVLSPVIKFMLVVTVGTRFVWNKYLVSQIGGMNG